MPVYMRFFGGEIQRFDSSVRELSKGYPDIYTYLRATGKVNCWCEEVPEELAAELEAARTVREKLRVKLLLVTS